MAVNEKKSIRLRNRTNYFDADKSRLYVEFSSPYTYQSRQQKIEGYETRLYWQHRYCIEHSGQTFFYTFTYNDAALPKFYGFNVFDYEDLRYLLNGGLSKKLLRHYGTKLKYFVGAELGDGKGERGLHNNPHYHVLFFLEPANNPRYQYRRISPNEFRSLCRLYWQGIDEGDPWYHCQSYKYGIVKEGEDCGLVQDFRAENYVAKYVCKDVKLVMHENKIAREYELRLMDDCEYGSEVREAFFDDYIQSHFNSLSPKGKYFWTDLQLYEMLAPQGYASHCRSVRDVLRDIDPDPDIPVPSKAKMVNDIIVESNLIPHFNVFRYDFIKRKVKELINLYRNRYCNKCRISQGVGEYALKFIDDPMDPKFMVPTKNGVKYRNACMYYYRKLFCDVVKDPFGRNVYVLNDLGIQYKCTRLPKQIEKIKNRVLAMVSVVNEDLYNKATASTTNTEIWTPYYKYINELNNKDLNKLCENYAKFKLIYEDRYFRLSFDGRTGEYSFPDLNPLSDYRRFITPSYWTTNYNPFRSTDFLEADCEDYLPYYSHPDFLCDLRLFSCFDLLRDYLFINTDDQNQRTAEEIAEVRRFHKKNQVKAYFFNQPTIYKMNKR